MRKGLLCIVLAACSPDASDDASPDTTSVASDTASVASDTASVASDSASDSSTSGDRCAASDLVWKTGNKTTYTSYPEPGSEECIEFSGCEYQGQFAACDNTMPETWVSAHEIAALYPLGDLALHDICVRAGGKTIVVTVIDTCADSDCDGCCSENRGSADALIDLEKYTNERFGVEDGAVEWADLGERAGDFDGCN